MGVMFSELISAIDYAPYGFNKDLSVKEADETDQRLCLSGRLAENNSFGEILRAHCETRLYCVPVSLKESSG